MKNILSPRVCSLTRFLFLYHSGWIFLSFFPFFQFKTLKIPPFLQSIFCPSENKRTPVMQRCPHYISVRQTEATVFNVPTAGMKERWGAEGIINNGENVNPGPFLLLFPSEGHHRNHICCFRSVTPSYIGAILPEQCQPLPAELSLPDTRRDVLPKAPSPSK